MINDPNGTREILQREPFVLAAWKEIKEKEKYYSVYPESVISKLVMYETQCVPVRTQFIIGQIVMRHVQHLERCQVTQHIFADIIQNIVTHIQILQMTGT